MAEATGSRWRFPRPRLSLRAVMMTVVILAGALGWVIHRARVQRQVVVAVLQAGGQVQYDWQWQYRSPVRPVWAPRWLVDSIGEDFFSSVSFVDFNQTGADEVARQVARLGSVEGVIFNGSDLTDAGLAELEGLNVRVLYLEVTQITDAGLASVATMPRLEAFDLFQTTVGDAGMAHLAKLPRLRWLHLGQTKVTDAGLESVARLPNLATLHLFGTTVGDPGVSRFRGSINLRNLSLEGTKVTQAMLDNLRAALPKATVTPILALPPVSPPGSAGSQGPQP